MGSFGWTAIFGESHCRTPSTSSVSVTFGRTTNSFGTGSSRICRNGFIGSRFQSAGSCKKIRRVQGLGFRASMMIS